MPNYSFVCDSCEINVDKTLTINQFLKIKKQKNKCQNCEHGVLLHKVRAIDALVEKSQEQYVMDMKEEVRKTVNKIKNGDKKTIQDIYGDRANPYKK